MHLPPFLLGLVQDHAMTCDTLLEICSFLQYRRSEIGRRFFFFFFFFFFYCRSHNESGPNPLPPKWKFFRLSAMCELLRWPLRGKTNPPNLERSKSAEIQYSFESSKIHRYTDLVMFIKNITHELSWSISLAGEVSLLVLTLFLRLNLHPISGVVVGRRLCLCARLSCVLSISSRQPSLSPEQSEKFLDLGTRTWRGDDVWLQWFLHAVSRNFDVGKSWSYIWLNAGLTTKVRVVARPIFFLLRHLSKFSSFKKKKSIV